MKVVGETIRTIGTRLMCILPSLLTCLAIGCQTLGTKDAGQQQWQLCQVRETVYDHGPQTSDIITVRPDSSYVWQQFDGRNQLFLDRYHQYQLKDEHIDFLSSELFKNLEKSVRSKTNWAAVNGVPTCYFAATNSPEQSSPAGVRELIVYAHDPPPRIPLNADELRQKMLGTWHVQCDPREPFTVRFDPDGTFHSAKPIGEVIKSANTARSDDLIFESNWQTHDGYFSITQGNALPRSLQSYFFVDRLDSGEMICGFISTAGRIVFRR
jgi:hypothetical protein